jgi:serine/threonine-protein kinase
MGVVLAATHLQLNQLVALKFLTIDIRENSSILARFEREARAAAQLKGQHVARVHDFGSLPGGSPYIVMEYLDGEDASDLVERDGPQPLDASLELVLQAAVALAEAHAVGIVHRDIKPANLFVTKRRNGRPLVKLLDFGISKITSQPEDGKLTAASTLGRPNESKRADSRHSSRRSARPRPARAPRAGPPRGSPAGRSRCGVAFPRPSGIPSIATVQSPSRRARRNLVLPDKPR